MVSASVIFLESKIHVRLRQCRYPALLLVVLLLALLVVLVLVILLLLVLLLVLVLVLRPPSPEALSRST